MYRVVLIFVSLIAFNSAFSDSGNLYAYHDTAERYDPNYIGGSIKIVHTIYETGYGNNLLTHNLPEIGVFSGVRLNENLSVEVGHESSILRERFNTLSHPERAAGTPIPQALSPINFLSKITIRGPYLDVIGAYPIRGRSSALFSMGVSFLKARAERHATCICNEFNGRNRRMKGDKFVLRLSTGFQYRVADNLRLRTTVGWMNTSKLRLKYRDLVCAKSYPEIRPKDTLNCSFGILWSFQ